MITQTYKDIDYTLRQGDRKTLSIYVERDGNVTVLAPQQLTSNDVNGIIELKRYWIYKSQSEQKELNRNKVLREIANGEGYLYLGNSHKLKIEKNLDAPISLTSGYFLLDQNCIDKAKSHFINFYREKGKEHIPQRIGYFKKKLGVEPKSVRIMDLKYRWASRSNNNTLNFHWKTMLAPLTIIDYIIVHEMAHMLKRCHNSEFWSIVSSIIPDYLERKEWLRKNGANLDI